MYLYDINENSCINLKRVSSMELTGNPAIYFSVDGETYYKMFSTEEEAREEYNRIKAMINDPPMLMTLDNENVNNFIIEKMRRK